MAFWTCGSNPICRASWRGIRRATTLGLCVDVPSPSFAFPVRRAAAAPKPRPRVFPSSRRRGVRPNGLAEPGAPGTSLLGEVPVRLLVFSPSEPGVTVVRLWAPPSAGSPNECLRLLAFRAKGDRVLLYVSHYCCLLVDSPSQPGVTVCFCLFRNIIAFSSSRLLSQE